MNACTTEDVMYMHTHSMSWSTVNAREDWKSGKTRLDSMLVQMADAYQADITTPVDSDGIGAIHMWYLIIYCIQR